MHMNWFQNLLMGFVSGITELLPISAEAHRALLRQFFGIASEDALTRLLIHMGCLAAVWWAMRPELAKLHQTRTLMKIPPRRRKHQPDSQQACTVRLLRTATLCMLIPKVFTLQLAFFQDHLNFLAIPLICNGILLILPAIFRSGNKDARNAPRLDGFLIGLSAGLSAVPGISPIGASLSVACARGADQKFALRFSCLLLLRVLAVSVLFDLIAAFTGGAAIHGLGILYGLLAAVMAFAGSSLAIRAMNFLTFGTGWSSFAYYSWGLALFCFILFLTV